MLPIHLLAWETDVTVRAAIEESAQASLAPIGAPTLLSGGEIACDARARGAKSLVATEARGRFARGFTMARDGGPPEDSVDADASGSATWSLSPFSTLALTGQTSIATTWGIRADSLFLARDPFGNARRLEYGFGADLSWSLQTSTQTELGVDGGATQEGALASDVASTVGADSREAHGGLAYSIDVAPRLSITPELRYSFTRYEHALLDIEGRRGRADIHSASLSLGGVRQMTPDLSLTASLGATLASPMPIAATSAPVMAPEIGVGLRYRGRRAQITARYAASYTSLGPRIGQGHQQSVTARFTTWPLAAADARGVMIRGLVRASHGIAPLGADPQVRIPGLPTPPTTGTLITTSIAGRAVMEIPISRGWSFTTGLDMMLARGHMAPAPPGGAPRVSLTSTITVGLAATLSTDKRRLYPRDPGADEDDARRRAGAHTGASVRVEDRTQVDVGREEEP